MGGDCVKILARLNGGLAIDFGENRKEIRLTLLTMNKVKRVVDRRSVTCLRNWRGDEQDRRGKALFGRDRADVCRNSLYCTRVVRALLVGVVCCLSIVRKKFSTWKN